MISEYKLSLQGNAFVLFQVTCIQNVITLIN